MTKSMQEILDFLWKSSMKNLSKKADVYMKDRGIEIITCPDPITVDDLYYKKDHSKIEQTNKEKDNGYKDNQA